jgi:uncharacterized membrane protein YsdA (DUF1294 family)
LLARVSKSKGNKTPRAGDNDGPTSWAWAVAWLALLVLPGLVVGRLSLRHDVAWVVIGAVGVSGVVFLLYAIDKRRAQTQGVARVPEAGLHALEFLGGWPGAFAAQRLLRHKSAKVAYQVRFWIIVAVWQGAALDYLLGWRMLRSVVSF